MRVLLADGDHSTLVKLERICKTVEGVEMIGVVLDVAKAVCLAAQEKADLIFLGITPDETDLLALSHQLRAARPKLQIVFVAADEQFAMDAWRADACGYLLKPVDAAVVRQVLSRAGLLWAVEKGEGIELSTFGRFDMFVNGRPVEFKHEKARELLALMTARLGGTTTMDVVIDRLWEGEEYTDAVKVKYRKAVMHLRQTLDGLGLSWMLHAARGRLWMDFTGVKCDFFDLVHGDPHAFALYHGAFMTEFSWSEYYLPLTEHLAQEFLKKS